MIRQNQTEPVKRRGLSRVVRAVVHSMHGLRAAFKLEEAFRQEVVIGVLLLLLIPFLPVNSLESVLLGLVVFIVWITELLNSGLEWTIDYISEEKHAYAKRVKDMGSAAVFLSLALLVFSWVLILKPYV